MLKFSVTQYFLALLLFLAVFFFTRNGDTGLLYSGFFLLALISLHFFSSTFYKGAFFVLLFSVTAGYFLRPLILVDHPELFMYPKIATGTDIGSINQSLLYALLSTLCLAGGFIVVIKSKKDRLPPVDRDPEFMLRHFAAINTIIVVLIAGKLFLMLTTGAGVKGDETKDSTFAFILKLLSPDISFVVYYIYLTRYWRRLTFRQKILTLAMIGLTSYSLFVTGSKAFIAMFALCFFFDFIYRNRSIRLTTFVVSAVSGFVVLGFSFIMSAAVKFSAQKDMNSIFNKAKYFASSETTLTVANEITKRMMGLDGQIAGYLISQRSDENVKSVIKESFSGREIILHTLTNIIPKVNFTNTPTSGKLISQHIVGLPQEVSHAGSLGLYASVYFMAGPYFFLFHLALGALIALYFMYNRQISNYDLRFVLYFLGCYFIIRTVLSGNFDVVLGEFIPKWILLYCYIQLIATIGRTRFTR